MIKWGHFSSLLRHLPLPIDEYYFHTNAVANLASLGRISEEFRTVFDSGVHNTFFVFNDNDTYINFDKERTIFTVYPYMMGMNMIAVMSPLWLETRLSSLNWTREERKQ